MRALSGFLVAIVACAPAPAPPPRAPPAPVLLGPVGGPPARFRETQLTLRITADGAATVRLFLSPDCSAPEFLRLPAGDESRSVEVDTVQGLNVFSADAVSPQGLRSSCSDPLVIDVDYPRRLEFPAPLIRQVMPPSPTFAPKVQVFGTAAPGWTVRVWSRSSCRGEVLVSDTSEAFERTGLEVPLVINGRRTVSLDARREGTLSQCSAALELENDSEPPTMGEPFSFPPRGWPAVVVVPKLSGADRMMVDFGGECPASSLLRVLDLLCPDPSCTTADAYVTELASWPEPVSASLAVDAADRAGNRAGCRVLEWQDAPSKPPFWIGEFDGARGRTLLLASGSDEELPKVYPDTACAGLELVPSQTFRAGGFHLRIFTGRRLDSVSLQRVRGGELLGCERPP